MFPTLQAKLVRYEEIERLLQDPDVLAQTSQMLEPSSKRQRKPPPAPRNACVSSPVAPDHSAPWKKRMCSSS